MGQARRRRWLAGSVLALLLVGCTTSGGRVQDLGPPRGGIPPAVTPPTKPAKQEAPSKQPSPGPAGSDPGQGATQNGGNEGLATKPGVTDRLPDLIPGPKLPLWGEPGQRLVGGTGEGAIGWTYLPVTIQGVTLTPVRTGQGTLFVRQDGDEIYLHGLLTSRGGYWGLSEPQLLYSLPLAVGATWKVDFPGMIGETWAYRVTGYEAVATPAGERKAYVIEAKQRSESPETEWWVPGYGLVRSEGKYRTWVAAREQAVAPANVSVVGHLLTGQQALIWDDDNTYWVTNLEDGQELYRVDDTYWRSWYRWVATPFGDLLTHAVFPGSWGIFGYRALHYSPAEDRFVEVEWLSGRGRQSGVAGSGDWEQEGRFRLEDFTGYPSRHYLFVYDGKVMRADPTEEREVRAKGSSEFVNRLFGAPPLLEADFVATFKESALGQQAWVALQAQGWERFGLATVTPIEAERMSYLVEEAGKRIRVRLEKGSKDFQVVEFQLID